MKVFGVDPGKTTGMASYDTETKTLGRLWSSTFWECMNECLASAADIFVVEVPHSLHVFSGGKAKGKAKEKVSANVGGVIREAQLIVEGLRLAGKTVVEVHPRGKIDAEKFKRMTGWEGKSNEHTRDAAMLCYRWRG